MDDAVLGFIIGAALTFVVVIFIVIGGDTIASNTCEKLLGGECVQIWALK